METRDFSDGALVTLTLAQIRANIRERASLNSNLENIQTDTGTVFGALFDVISGRIHDVEEALPDLLDMFDWDSAEGQALESLASLIGLEKDAATATAGTVTLTGTPAVVVPSGTRFRVPGGAIFSLDSDATIAGGGTVDALVTCLETGPFEIGSGEVTEIVDAVSGLTSVTNSAAFTTGQNAETDSDLREKRNIVKTGLGHGHPDKLESDLINIDSVLSANVIDNDTDSTDSYDTPPHSIQPIIYPDTADQDEIADAIYNNKSAGIQTYGDESATITNSVGKERTVYWSWPDEVDIYIKVLLERENSASITSDLQTATKAVILEYGENLGPGDDVCPDIIEAKIMTDLGADWDLRQCRVYASKSSIPTSPYTGLDVPLTIDVDKVSIWDTTDMSVDEVP